MAKNWTVDRMPGFRISHPYAAHDPNCPPGPHPTRDCRCRVFRSAEDAQAYIDTHSPQRELLPE